MPVFAMPILLMINSDSVAEAQKIVDDWHDELELDRDLPSGVENIDTNPSCEINDDGDRVLYLPNVDEEITSDELDDFNEGETFFD